MKTPLIHLIDFKELEVMHAEAARLCQRINGLTEQRNELRASLLHPSSTEISEEVFKRLELSLDRKNHLIDELENQYYVLTKWGSKLHNVIAN